MCVRVVFVALILLLAQGCATTGCHIGFDKETCYVKGEVVSTRKLTTEEQRIQLQKQRNAIMMLDSAQRHMHPNNMNIFVY